MNAKSDFFDNTSQLINDIKQLEVVQKTIHLLNTKEYFANINFTNSKTKKDSTKFMKIRKKLLRDIKNIGCSLNNYNVRISHGFGTLVRVELIKCIRIKKNNIKFILNICDLKDKISNQKEKIEVELENKIHIEQKINIKQVKVKKITAIYYDAIRTSLEVIQTEEKKINCNGALFQINKNEDSSLMNSNETSMCNIYCINFDKILKELSKKDTNDFLNYVFFNKDIGSEHFELLYDVNIHKLDFLSLFKTDLNTIMTPFLSIDKNKGLKNEYR